MALTIQQVEHLIEQVGIGIAAADIDLSKLKLDIDRAGVRYRSRRLSSASPVAKKKWLEQTQSSTAKLQKALADEENARWFSIRAPATFSTRSYPNAVDAEDTISLSGLKAALDGLHEEVTKQLSGRPLDVFELSRSPFEYLAGEHLPLIFSKHFKRKVGISRAADGGKPQGPLLRFVKASLNLLGVTKRGEPYKDEAIIKAIRDTKSRPSRRKSAAIGQKS